MKRISILLISFTPLSAFAAPSTFKEVINIFIDLINTALPVIAGLALLVFFKGLVQFIWNSGDESKHADGKQLMIWGLIALFVMVSLLGIINYAYSDFGFSRPFGVPVLPTR